VLTSAADADGFTAELAQSRKDGVPVVDLQWLIDVVNGGLPLLHRHVCLLVYL